MVRTRRAAEPETAPVQEDTVTDTINETAPVQESPEGQETEAPTAEPKHTFNVGDEANVVRGKHRGLKGSILKFNAAGKTYAVELEDGSLIVVNAGNLKPPADSTVSVAALVTVLAAFQATDPEVTERIVAALAEAAPGLDAKLAEATAA